LYNLAKSYFSERTATMSTNTIQLERNVSKGRPKEYCCGSGFWNIQFNSLLNLDFGKSNQGNNIFRRFANSNEGETIRKAENFANIKIKIHNGLKTTKFSFMNKNLK
jgi:hypothetical protein